PPLPPAPRRAVARPGCSCSNRLSSATSPLWIAATVATAVGSPVSSSTVRHPPVHDQVQFAKCTHPAVSPPSTHPYRMPAPRALLHEQVQVVSFGVRDPRQAIAVVLVIGDLSDLHASAAKLVERRVKVVDKDVWRAAIPGPLVADGCADDG